MSRSSDEPAQLRRRAPGTRASPLVRQLGRQPQAAGLRHRDAVAQARGRPPGDATAEQMDTIADLADRYSFGEIRVGHEQNLVLPHVAQRDLPALWQALDAIGVATPNVGLVSDIISCPGLDYCSLANTRSIPVAQELTRRLPGSRSRARSRPAAHQHFRLHQCLRPSSRRPYRPPRRREERRGILPGDHRRARRRACRARRR